MILESVMACMSGFSWILPTASPLIEFVLNLLEVLSIVVAVVVVVVVLAYMPVGRSAPSLEALLGL